MSITYDAQTRIFHLATAHTSYIIGLDEGGAPLHLYWGARLADPDVWAIQCMERPHVSFEVDTYFRPYEYP